MRSEEATKMYKALSPGAVGVKVSGLREAVEAAGRGGFGGVEFNPREVADMVEAQGADAVTAIFADAGIRPVGFGLPVEWRKSEDEWRRSLDELPRLAKAAAAIGGKRTFTWIPSASDERPLDENRRFHVERFAPVAEILGEHGVHLGLEFLGPQTIRAGKKYPFLYTLSDMAAMGREIGPNVGVLLDSWHWYTSGDTLDSIRALKPEQVVYVHVNDAPANVALDAQIDNTRRLPGATGVIDIAGFLKTLAQIGYDGPVTPEPFDKTLAELPSDAERLRVVAQSMDTIFAQAGITPA